MFRVSSRISTAALFAAALALVASGCAREIVGDPPPLDRPHYPRGLAVHPDRPILAVVGSNFDLEFNRGALLLADLEAVDEAIASAGGEIVHLEGSRSPYSAVALVPSFGNTPVFVQEGSRLLLSTQEQNRLSEIPLAPDEIAFDCEAEAPDTDPPVPLCATSQSSLQFPGNDPAEIAILEDGADRVRAIVTLLNSPDVFYVTLDASATGASRLAIDTSRSFSLESYSERGEGLGSRGIALWPGRGGVRTQAFMTVARTSTTFSGTAVDLVWFDAAQGRGAPLGILRLTDELGSLGARGIAVAPDGSALFVVLRNPDAIARLDVTPVGGSLRVRVGGVVSTCEQPVALAAASLPTSSGREVTRVLVTCYGSDTIVAYDANTLVETDVVRRLGDGPYGLALDLAHAPPRAYVGFFDDDRVAVLDLVDDEGDAALVPRALIGASREGVEAAQ